MATTFGIATMCLLALASALIFALRAFNRWATQPQKGHG